MVLHRIRRTAAWAGLLGALALVAPAGTASAKTHGQPTPLTVTPQLAERTSTSSSTTSAPSAGIIQVAQTDRQVRRRRAANRRQASRQRTANRRQVRRERTADRRQVRRQRTANRRQNRRIYRNGRWYTYHDDRWYDDSGAAVAAGVIGLAAGAIAGSALASQPRVVYEDPGIPAPYTAEWYRQCDLKYNSFRASDGTYLGYDGKRHTCRLP